MCRNYARVADEFSGVCASTGESSIDRVQPVHIETGTRELAVPSVARRSSRIGGALSSASLRSNEL
jgi:hypothetical protein